LNAHGEASMRGGIRRQGLDSWQIRVYNRSARRNEYFAVTGTLKDGRDARHRRVAQTATSDDRLIPRPRAVHMRDIATYRLGSTCRTRRPAAGRSITRDFARC
jgi:hypothetical protein